MMPFLTVEETERWIEERRSKYPYMIRLPILHHPDKSPHTIGIYHASAPHPDRTRTWMFQTEDDLNRFMRIYVS